MSKKILVNGITLEGANIVPLLLKVREWESQGYQVTFIGTAALRKEIEIVGTLKSIRFITLSCAGEMGNKFHFIYNALKKNLLVFFQARKLAREFDIVYTISPVLDLVLLPLVLKMIRNEIRWVTVFDNTVPLIVDGKFVAGNKLVRFLAWIFYQISLLILRLADRIFVIKPELCLYLKKRGFSQGVLVLTGNGVEKELIENAKIINDYKIDALFVGRVNEAKGIYDMLKVLKIITVKYPNFQLAVMGRGDEITEKKFQKCIDDMDLGNNVQMLGYKFGQEKFDIIRSSKIFLFLSETESLPIAPLEAVCSGLKTFVYDLDAYSMYKNGEVIISKKNDWKSVADKVIAVFMNQDFENKVGRLLLDKYSWSTVSQIELNSMKSL